MMFKSFPPISSGFLQHGKNTKNVSSYPWPTKTKADDFVGSEHHCWPRSWLGLVSRPSRREEKYSETNN